MKYKKEKHTRVY